MSDLKFIDLFAGCGGLSLGLIKAGWKGVFAIEKTPDAFKTLKHNLCSKTTAGFDWPSWLPCQEMTTSELLAKYHPQLEKLRGKVDLIAGGPPCQGFSFAGRRNPDDPRNQLTGEYIELVNIIRPKFLLLENVKGFKTAFKDTNAPAYAEVVSKTLSDLDWGGYQVHSSMLNASKFGVPQPRARFIMIAIRKDVEMHQQVCDPFQSIEQYCQDFRDSKKLNGHEISVKEAISDLETKGKSLIRCPDTKGFKQIKYAPSSDLTPYQKLMRMNIDVAFQPNSLRLANHRDDTIAKFVDVLKTCEKGKSLSKDDRERYGMKKHCFTPLAPDQISKTVTTLPDDLLHYSEPRILTVRENARLQSFPDWFEFCGKYTTGGSRRKEECPRYTQVGNAVPPLMAEALGLLIIGLGGSEHD